MTVHNFAATDATITDSEFLKLSGAAVETIHLGEVGDNFSTLIPTTIDTKKSDWWFKRVYWQNSYQPTASDGPSDGTGKVNCFVDGSGGGSYWGLIRQLEAPLSFGSDTAQTANGLYLDIDVEQDSTQTISRLGVVPWGFCDNDKIHPVHRMYGANPDMRGKDATGDYFTSSNLGSSISVDTKYYIRITSGSDSVAQKWYTTDADRTSDTNVHRTCTVASLGPCFINAVGFLAFETGGNDVNVKIYKFDGTLCDWYGANKSILFDAVDFGATAKYLDFSTISATATGSVKYQIRVQETDGVWSDYWAAMTASELILLQYTTPVYAYQVKVIFNDCTGSSAASFTSLSVTSSETNPYGATPDAPTVTASDDETGTSITVTFSASDTGVTNYLYYKLRTASAWTAAGNRSGDGTIQVTGLTQGSYYDFIGISASGSVYSLPSSVASAWATDGVTGGPVIELAEAVKDELNNTTWTQTFTAERDYLAFKKLEEIRDLFVFITPNAETITPTSRQADQNDIIIDVCITQSDVTKTETDALMDLIDEIHGHFMRIVLDDKYHCTAITIDPIYDQETLREDNRFISVMRLTFAYRRSV